MSRFLLSLSLILALASCASRGAITYEPRFVAQAARVQSVYIASNRQRKDVNGDVFWAQEFGANRDATLRFGRMDIAVPHEDVHTPGKIEWPPRGRLDPKRHFFATANVGYADAGAMTTALSERAPETDTVVVFVHGFNVNSAEAIYRLAQVAVDYQASDPVIAYSWPSAGNPRGYVYDRDSVMFSRDGLDHLLTTLTDRRKQVLVIGHSMGTQLVMETLRQLSISGKSRVLERIYGVVLISPDIDEDVFVQQAQRVTPFPQPFTLLIDTRDRALSLSAFLTGKPTRLGSISDVAAVKDKVPVEVIALDGYAGGDRIAHNTAFTAPEAIRMLQELARAELVANPLPAEPLPEDTAAPETVEDTAEAPEAQEVAEDADLLLAQQG